MPLKDTGRVPGAAGLRADASRFPAGLAAGGTVATLIDPFAGLGLGTTGYATFGAVPGQLALSADRVVAGAGAAGAGASYALGILATAGDGSRKLGETLVFTAVAGAERWTVIGNRTLIANGRTAAGAARYYGQGLTTISPPYEVRSPRACFAGWYGASISGETALGNDVLYEGVWLQIGTAAPVALTVGGAGAFTVPDGGQAWTDENALVIPPGTILRWLWADDAGSGYRTASGPPSVAAATFANAAGKGDCGQFGASSAGAAMAGASAPNLTAGTALRGAPILLAGKASGTPAAALIVGDSIGWGYNHNAAASGLRAGDRGQLGALAMALGGDDGGRLPYANFAIPGTQFTSFSDAAFARRRAVLETLAHPYSVIVSNMGRNSATYAGSAVQATADARAGWAYLKAMSGGRRVVQTTVTAMTDAKDDPAGTANGHAFSSPDPARQLRRTAGNAEAALIALNALIADDGPLPANVDAVIDWRGAVEAAGAPRKWKAGAAYALQAAVAAGAATLSLDAAPQPGDWLVIDGGSTADSESVVADAIAGGGPFTVTLRSACAKAHAAGAGVAGQLTNDGLHPVTQGAYLMKAAVVAAKQAGVLG